MRFQKLYNLLNSVIALIGIIVLAPLLLAIAVAIMIKSGSPVFFTQFRVGKDGKLFKIYKFRTMLEHESVDTVSVMGQQRITPLGATLRKYKLDELPELWNVFRGEMNFVGPRPDVPGYADILDPENRIILSILPGITGPASLKFRNEEKLLAKVENPVEFNRNVIYPEKVRINKKYVHQRTLLLDLKIVLRTIFSKNFIEY